MHLLEGAMPSYLESCRKPLLTNLDFNAISSGLGVGYVAEQGDFLRMQKKKGTQNTARASALPFLSKCDWNVDTAEGKRWKSRISAKKLILHNFL